MIHLTRHPDPPLQPGLFGRRCGFVFTIMDTEHAFKQLCDSGVRFSITVGARGGFVVKYGDYVRTPAATAEAATVEEAMSWLCRHLNGQHGTGALETGTPFERENADLDAR